MKAEAEAKAEEVCHARSASCPLSDVQTTKTAVRSSRALARGLSSEDARRLDHGGCQG